MNFLKTVSRASKGATLALAVVAMSGVNANAQTEIINDSFADGISNLGELQLDFFTTSASAALDPDQLPGPLDFATGGSSRTIHSLFPAQTLDELGDVLTVTFDFTTPTSIAVGGPSEDFKFGLFDTNTTAGDGAVVTGAVINDVVTGSPIDFSGNISSSSSTSQPGLNIAGIQCEIDNINASGTDLGIRTHNVTNNLLDLAPGSEDALDFLPTGRHFGTNDGFDFIAGGDDDIVSLLPNENYTGTISIAYTDDSLTTFEITVGMAGTGANGPFNDVFTRTVSIADENPVPGDPAADPPTEDFGGRIGVNTTSFDLIAFHATGGAFGGSNVRGEPDNGIDISNVTITFLDMSDMDTLKGDVDLNGFVEFADIPAFIQVLIDQGNQPEADADCNGFVEFADIPAFIEILIEAATSQ